jgi:hypothetical protein
VCAAGEPPPGRISATPRAPRSPLRKSAPSAAEAGQCHWPSNCSSEHAVAVPAIVAAEAGPSHWPSNCGSKQASRRKPCARVAAEAGLSPWPSNCRSMHASPSSSKAQNWTAESKETRRPLVPATVRRCTGPRCMPLWPGASAEAQAARLAPATAATARPAWRRRLPVEEPDGCRCADAVARMAAPTAIAPAHSHSALPASAGAACCRGGVRWPPAAPPAHPRAARPRAQRCGEPSWKADTHAPRVQAAAERRAACRGSGPAIMPAQRPPPPRRAEKRPGAQQRTRGPGPRRILLHLPPFRRRR